MGDDAVSDVLLVFPDLGVYSEVQLDGTLAILGETEARGPCL